MDDRSDTIVLCPKCGSPPPSVSGCMADDCPTQEIIDMMCQPPANHPAQNPTTTKVYDMGAASGRAWAKHDEAWKQFNARHAGRERAVALLREALQSDHLTPYVESRIRAALLALVESA